LLKAPIPVRLREIRTDLATRYNDDQYEYRHVQLPKAMLKAIPKEYHDPNKGTLKLLWEEEWRAIGITQVCLGPVRSCALLGEDLGSIIVSRGV